MANQTVYPYGTGGSLPSSIGVINDFTTGGSDKALSAEKGKDLGQAVFDIPETVNLSSLTVHAYSLGSTNNSWVSQGKHIVPEVTPGETIIISVVGVSGSDGGFYGFFTSEYTPPTSSSSSTPYVSGGRQWLDTGTITLIVPQGAAYLCLCTKDGSGSDKTWTMSRIISRRDVLYKTDVVNALNSNATDAPLSAAMGKELSQMITGEDPIPSGLTKHEYIGPLVKIQPMIHKVATRNVATITSISCQGGACYGDYLFMFTERNTTCWIYNLATSSLLQTYTIPEAERGFVSTCHCNSVNFGTEKYDANDPFPLIYVSTGYTSDGYSGALVYRIVATVENDTTTYSLVLVQTLKMPSSLGWTEFIIGEDGDCYIKSESGGIRYYRMTLPTFSQGDYTFDVDNALAVYRFPPQPSWYNGSQNQGHIYHNGKIYFVSGSPTSQASLFVVLDLATCRREVEIDLYNTLGLTSESETVFIWNNRLCIAFRSNTHIYALYFE